MNVSLHPRHRHRRQSIPYPPKYDWLSSWVYYLGIRTIYIITIFFSVNFIFNLAHIHAFILFSLKNKKFEGKSWGMWNNKMENSSFSFRNFVLIFITSDFLSSALLAAQWKCDFLYDHHRWALISRVLDSENENGKHRWPQTAVEKHWNAHNRDIYCLVNIELFFIFIGSFDTHALFDNYRDSGIAAKKTAIKCRINVKQQLNANRYFFVIEFRCDLSVSEMLVFEIDDDWDILW